MMRNIYLGDYAYLIPETRNELFESSSYKHDDFEKLSDVESLDEKEFEAAVNSLVDRVNVKLSEKTFYGETRFTPETVGGFRLEYVRSKRKWVVFDIRTRPPKPLDATVEFNKKGVAIETSRKRYRDGWERNPRSPGALVDLIIVIIKDEINKHLDEISKNEYFKNPTWENLVIHDIEHMSDKQFHAAILDLVDSLNEYLRISKVEAFIDKNLIIRSKGKKIGKITYDRKYITVEVNYDKDKYHWGRDGSFTLNQVERYIRAAVE